jgi:hypothetical protein
MSSRKSRSSKDKSDEKTAQNRKADEAAKRKEPYNHGEEPQKKAGREREVHEKIIARHYEGGAPPSPEAYARALQQWQRLPGSVVRPPTDVRPPAKEPPKSSHVTESTEATDDAREGKHRS